MKKILFLLTVKKIIKLMGGINFIKKLLFILILLFISLSCVNAVDISSDNLTSTDNLNQSSLNDLSQEINNSNGQVNLTHDYYYQSGDGNVKISKNLTLNGGGHTIDSGNLSFIFKIDENAKYSIVLNNIIFKNCKTLFNKNHASITMINCDIIDKQGNSYINFPEVDDPLTFDDLNYEISNSNGVLNLNESYKSTSSDDNIKLFKNIILNGNGNYINGGSSEYVFELIEDTNYTIIIKDIIFENFNKIFNTLQTQITVVDCDFNDVNDDYIVSIVLRSSEDSVQGYCDAPSDEIIEKAKSIVGIYTGIDAAKKLAKWVKKNIKHETKAGFYQSPDETLKRKVGNCCSQTELFLLMCIAVGIDKECKLSFVHYGKMIFKQRHFFALVDNVCVDVDGGYDDPWAHGVNFNRNVYNITEYPLLPIARNY